MCVIALFAYGFATGGNHRDAVLEVDGYQVATVCPSAGQYLARVHASVEALADLGCPVPRVEVGTCPGLPRAGEVQLRDCVDVVVGVPSCDLEHVDLVLHGDGAGLAYLTDQGVEHALGHVVGLGHTTAARSYMAARPGSEWSSIDCTGRP